MKRLESITYRSLQLSVSVMLVSILLVAPLHAESQTSLKVSVQQLGALQQQTQTVTAITHFSGSQLLGTVSELPGQAYVLKAPMNIQQAVYVRPPGTVIKAGEDFVKLIGPEVHRYYAQYKIYQQLHTQSQTLYVNNQRLFKNKSINESDWLAITEQYYKIKLAYDEYEHFFAYVTHVDEEQDSLTIGAPIAGLVIYDSLAELNIDEIIGRFVPENAVRVHINVPVANQLSAAAENALQIKTIQLPHCMLEISQRDQRIEQFYQSIWSAPITKNCNLKLGEQVSLIPQYYTQAYKISQDSVFSWEGQSYIWIKEADSYTAVKVDLLASEQQMYIVTAQQSLANKLILTTSVSAVQGVLLGLGE